MHDPIHLPERIMTDQFTPRRNAVIRQDGLGQSDCPQIRGGNKVLGRVRLHPILRHALVGGGITGRCKLGHPDNGRDGLRANKLAGLVEP